MQLHQYIPVNPAVVGALVAGLLFVPSARVLAQTDVNISTATGSNSLPTEVQAVLASVPNTNIRNWVQSNIRLVSDPIGISSGAKGIGIDVNAFKNNNTVTDANHQIDANQTRQNEVNQLLFEAGKAFTAMAEANPKSTAFQALQAIAYGTSDDAIAHMATAMGGQRITGADPYINPNNYNKIGVLFQQAALNPGSKDTSVVQLQSALSSWAKDGTLSRVTAPAGLAQPGDGQLHPMPLATLPGQRQPTITANAPQMPSPIRADNAQPIGGGGITNGPAQFDPRFDIWNNRNLSSLSPAFGGGIGSGPTVFRNDIWGRNGDGGSNTALSQLLNMANADLRAGQACLANPMACSGTLPYTPDQVQKQANLLKQTGNNSAGPGAGGSNNITTPVLQPDGSFKYVDSGSSGKPVTDSASAKVAAKSAPSGISGPSNTSSSAFGVSTSSTASARFSALRPGGSTAVQQLDAPGVQGSNAGPSSPTAGLNALKPPVNSNPGRPTIQNEAGKKPPGVSTPQPPATAVRTPSVAGLAASSAATGAASRAASGAASRAASNAASRAASNAAGRAASNAAANAASHVRIPSDIRLKQDIVALERTLDGLQLYRYRYRGDDTLYVGVMAQEVAQRVPSAVARGANGYLEVDYRQLGLEFLTYDEWTARRLAQARNQDQPP